MQENAIEVVVDHITWCLSGRESSLSVFPEYGTRHREVWGQMEKSGGSLEAGL